jgi:pSer/pThr/pTyr-binding forkhead associated (FHA) protein
MVPVFKVWADEGSHPPVKLDRPVCVIGRRAAGVNLSLQSPQVSKMHALVVRDARRGVYLRDLASTNGVQRNGAPVHEAGLSDEDVLRIGSYTFRCDSGFSRDTTDDALPAAELVGDGVQFAFPPGQQTVLIGRRQGCDLLLDDEAVAPVHAIVFQLDGQRYVRDLGAPVGTRLNGRRIHQEPLSAGDELRIGGVTMRYTPSDIGRPDSDNIPPLDGPEIPELDEPPIAQVDEEPSLAEMEDSGIPLLDQSGTSMMAEPVVEPVAEPEPAAASPSPEPQLEAAGESRIPMHDSLVSIEDSRAPGTPDVAPVDSSILEPHPPHESSFHGEVVEFGADVFPLKADAEAPKPIDDALRPMGSHVDDVHLTAPKPAKRAKRSGSAPKKSRRKPKR